MRFSYRQYRDGDCAAINDLYHCVTGRLRTADQFEWQWLRAPAGCGDMWLIEAEQDDGSVHLIGHHGLMPLVFSQGAVDLIFGKTENTMVHPDYRHRLLYPIFERTFLQQYSTRFDALFSTMGPAAALRQREALGYHAREEFIRYVWLLRRSGLLDYVAWRLGYGEPSRLRRAAAFGLSGVAGSLATVAGWRKSEAENPLVALQSREAVEHPFFETFWSHASGGYGLTPRRTQSDLAWRFWNNPYGNFVTLVAESRFGGDRCGYAIVRQHSKGVLSLDDIVVHPYEEAAFLELLRSVLVWCADSGAGVVQFLTTTDDVSPRRWIEGAPLPNLADYLPAVRRAAKRSPMLRRISEPLASRAGAAADKWYVTAFVAEGR
ncbi:MAG: hypothetical protein J0H84_26740 [Rhizobiales bacterium]|nr:hypothetical protein [Hyphomicrobiales bacterium]